MRNNFFNEKARDNSQELNSYFVQAANSLTQLYKKTIAIQQQSYLKGQADAHKQIYNFLNQRQFSLKTEPLISKSLLENYLQT